MKVGLSVEGCYMTRKAVTDKAWQGNPEFLDECSFPHKGRFFAWKKGRGAARHPEGAQLGDGATAKLRLEGATVVASFLQMPILIGN